MARALRTSLLGEGMEQLAVEITCSHCQQHYQEPKLLKCCHFFCKNCLQDLLMGSATREENAQCRSAIQCPECKETTNLNTNSNGGQPTATAIGELLEKQLPPVLYVEHLKQLYERVAKLNGKQDTPCDSCSELKASAFCQQCMEFICTECVASHRKMKVKFAGHKIFSFDELKKNDSGFLPLNQPSTILPVKCQVHEEPCKLYCFDCSALICRDCIVIDHSQHRYDFVKKSAAIYRQGISHDLAPLATLHERMNEATKNVEKMKSDVTSQGSFIADHICRKFAEMIEILQRKERELLTKAEAMVQLKLTNLDIQEKALAKANQLVHNLINYVQHNLDIISDEEFLQTHHLLHGRMEEEREKNNEIVCTPVEAADIAVKVTLTNDISVLSQLKASVYQFPAEKENTIHTAEVGKESLQFVLDESDTSHVMTQPITATLKSLVDGSSRTATVFKAGKGLYEVGYTPKIRGRHELHISVGDQPIPTSPLLVFVTIPPSMIGPDPIRTIAGVRHPYAATFNAKQQLLVTESSGMKVRAFTREGEELKYDKSPFARLMIESPTGLDIDKDGCLYVASASNHTFMKFSRDGALVKEIGGQGSDFGEMVHPCGVSVIRNEVYVCDRNNCRIQVFDQNLEPIRSFGSQGSKEGQLNWPYDVVRDVNGELYVADCDNHRIQVFKENSNSLERTIGGQGSGLGKLKRPMGVCMGADGRHIFVTEFDNHRVSVFEKDGRFVRSLGKYGMGKGDLCYPAGITMDCDGYVYVCDQGNNRVQVF